MYENKGIPRVLIILLFFLVILSDSLEVLIVHSNSTKSMIPSLISDIKSSIANFSSIEIIHCDYSLIEEEILMHSSLLAIFDITNILNCQFEISKLCEKNNFIHFQVSGSLFYSHKWTFSLSSSQQSLNDAFIATLSYFNWTTGLAVSSAEIYPNWRNCVENYSEKIWLFSVCSDTSIEDLVQREFMKLGSSLFFLFADKNTSIAVQQALTSSKMLTKGAGILLIGESYYAPSIEGALGIVEKGKEKVDSYEKYVVSAISEMIFYLANSSSPLESLILLSKKCYKYYCTNEFSLINTFKGQKKIVGSIKDGFLSLSSALIFPGNSTNIPSSQKKVIEISANDGSTNPGAEPSAGMVLYKRGLTLAMNDINKGIDILQNFQLKLNDFDCGVLSYNATFNYNCLKKDKDKLGLARIFSPGSSVAYGEIANLAKLNITIPCVGFLNFDPGLSNSTIYPFYSRVSLPSNILYMQDPLLFKVMGWNNFAIIYENSSLGYWGNYYFSQVAAQQNLNIVNELRIIPQLLSRDQIKNYSNVFQEVINTNVRLVALLLSPPLINYAAELFYDLGMRKGDLLLFSYNTAWITEVASKDNYTYKRLEVAVPLMTVFQSLFIGEKGNYVYNKLYTTYGNTAPVGYACSFYDAAYLIATALDWAINQGRDYTNPSILQAAIRDVTFTGCGGKVHIQRGSNDVQMTSFTIQSNSYNYSTGMIHAFDVGYFTPLNSQLLTIKTPFVYPDGTTNKPSDFRITSTNCPFDDTLKQTFFKGRVVSFAVCFFVAAITGIITFLIWKKWWKIEVELLSKQEEISVSDIIVGSTIVVEFFQLLSQGPDIRPLNSFLADVGDAVSLDLQTFVKLENGTFWWFATIIIVLCWIWVIFCIEIFFQLDEKFNHIWIIRNLGNLADYSMPILGNLCFIPFLSILLEIFICDNSIGDNWSESYLSVDCYQYCWQGDHIIYVILSSISLIGYEPFAVYARPLWQEFQRDLHVKSFPLYLMLKTVVQVIIIVLNKTLKRSSDIAHGFVFTVLLIFYIGCFYKFKAFNYGRFNWWHKLSLIGVAWVSFLSTINFLIQGSIFPWISLILGGWAIIVLIGLIVQKKKYPSLLYRKKGKDTSTLFKFAFTFGKKSSSLHSKILPQKLVRIK